MLIEEGEHVDKDQVLARLEDTAQKAALAQARAQQQAAVATLAQYQAQLAQARRFHVINLPIISFPALPLPC